MILFFPLYFLGRLLKEAMKRLYILPWCHHPHSVCFWTNKFDLIFDILFDLLRIGINARAYHYAIATCILFDSETIFVALLNFFTGIFAGFAVFGFLGYLAWKLGTSIHDVVDSGICYYSTTARLLGPPASTSLIFK